MLSKKQHTFKIPWRIEVILQDLSKFAPVWVQVITTGLHFILKALHAYHTHTHTQSEESPIRPDDKSKTMPDIQL